MKWTTVRILITALGVGAASYFGSRYGYTVTWYQECLTFVGAFILTIVGSEAMETSDSSPAFARASRIRQFCAGFGFLTYLACAVTVAIMATKSPISARIWWIWGATGICLILGYIFVWTRHEVGEGWIVRMRSTWYVPKNRLSHSILLGRGVEEIHETSIALQDLRVQGRCADDGVVDIMADVTIVIKTDSIIGGVEKFCYSRFLELAGDKISSELGEHANNSANFKSFQMESIVTPDHYDAGGIPFKWDGLAVLKIRKQ